MEPLGKGCEDVDWKAAASLYAQKFLTYLVTLISIFVIHLQIFFNVLNQSENLGVIRWFIIISNVPLFISLCIFGYLVGRTSIEMYAIEKENRTIPCIFNLVQKHIGENYLYERFTPWFNSSLSWRRISKLLIFAIIILLIGDLLLSYFIIQILSVSSLALLILCCQLISIILIWCLT